MPLLVLDKSAVVAAKANTLAALRTHFDFLLTDTLLYEIATERLDHRDLLREWDSQRLDDRVAASLAKVQEAGSEWLECSEALRWEIERGKPGKTAPRLTTSQLFSQDNILETLKEVREECLRYERTIGNLAAVKHAPGDDADFVNIRRMDRRSFLGFMEVYLSSDDFRGSLVRDARQGFAESAARQDVEVSPSFVPDRGWLAYGIELANRSFLPWKLWRVGDEATDPRKPANAFFDNLYIAFMAIGDGILSCDKDLLTLSWLCWPDKQTHIFQYDMMTHELKQFTPDWHNNGER